MPKTYRYTVAGRYPFPEDMLRYDVAEPASEVDRAKIANLRRAADRTTYEVTLVGREPTEARWKSFGWFVLSSLKPVA